MKMKAAFHTLGCKVNQYETEAIREKFLDAGFETVEFNDIADVYIINTCSVTSESERKSRQMIRRARAKNKDAIVAVTGCYAQVSREQAEKITQADIITGTKDKNKLLELVLDFLKNRNRIVSIDDIAAEKEFESSVICNYDEKTRVFVKIEDGCNNFCSYCIIPYARGRVRSKPLNEAYKEISGLVENGYHEIVLTGIHLDSYGMDFNDGTGLINLLELITDIKGLKRIRLGSLEPKFINESAIERLKSIKNLCPHFHLSLQSGCDETLKRMNRRYTTEEYRNAVRILRNAFEDCAITTDIIAGFPGETDEEFEKTMSFVSGISFSGAHIFIYSKRPGTKAYDMPAQVDENVKKERSERLIKQTQKDRLEFLSSHIGKNVEVLFESGKDEIYEGFTRNYIPVKVKSGAALKNLEKRVTIDRVNMDFCEGHIE